MTEHLSPLERDVVDLLQEESAEVLLELVPLLLAQAVGRLIKLSSKVKRFGNVQNPFAAEDAKPNFELLEEEIGDFHALVDILAERGVLSKERIAARVAWKRGMLKTHGSLDFTKDDAREPTAPAEMVFGGYVNKAPYNEMRLRMAMTGSNAPSEAEWVAALKRLTDFVERVDNGTIDGALMQAMYGVCSLSPLTTRENDTLSAATTLLQILLFKDESHDA